MLRDFVIKYWLETLFTTTSSVSFLIIKYLYNRIQREMKEQKLIKAGVLAILHDRLYQTCQYYIYLDCITIEALDNIRYMYDSYHELGGNGTGTELYNRCKCLRIVSSVNTNENVDVGV